MNVKELINYLQHYPNQNYTIIVHSNDPLKLISGNIAVEEVYLGTEKLPVLYIGEKKL